jgi:hypothetical protein
MKLACTFALEGSTQLIFLEDTRVRYVQRARGRGFPLFNVAI